MLLGKMVNPELDNRQRRGVVWTVAGLVAVIALILALFLNKMLTPRMLSPAELRLNGAIMFDAPRQLQPFELVNHRGEAFTVDNLKGHWSLIYFGFTHCPDICPTTLMELNRLTDKLDSDVAAKTEVMMVTVDPARDTEDTLSQYVRHFNPEFVGVTGEFREIMRFTQSVNVAFSKVTQGDTYTVDHTGNLVLINPYGDYHGFFKPPFDLAKLKLTFQSVVTQFERDYSSDYSGL